MATLMERVQEIVADKLSVDESEVVAEASFMEDLNADSLDLVELIMAFEEEFSDGDTTIEISDEDAEGITTVQAGDRLTCKREWRGRRVSLRHTQQSNIADLYGQGVRDMLWGKSRSSCLFVFVCLSNLPHEGEGTK